jgi:cytochrome c-type biogenesis protein CcmH/NrfF
MFDPEQTPDEVLQELSNDLMSPFCPGRTIAACPSSAARKLEDEILAEAKSGKSRDQIEQILVDRYGSDIVGYKPPPLVLWGTIVIGALALMWLVSLGRRWARGARATAGGVGEAPEGPYRGDEGSPKKGKPSRVELDALDDALDEEDGF